MDVIIEDPSDFYAIDESGDSDSPPPPGETHPTQDGASTCPSRLPAVPKARFLLREAGSRLNNRGTAFFELGYDVRKIILLTFNESSKASAGDDNY